MDRRFARVQSLMRGLEGCGCGAICPRVSLEYGNWRRMAAVFREMESANGELLSDCTLPELSRYCGLVRCERHDPSECEEGLLWLLGKALIRWGYDLLPAIWQLEEDVDRRLDAFRRAFDARVGLSISRHITAPLQAKLPILRELLGTGTY